MPRDLVEYPETNPLDADGAILLRAAELIEKSGWWNGTEVTFGEDHHCAIMAIASVTGRAIGLDEIDRFALRLGVKSIASWNDAQPNAEAVTSHMRACAYVPVPA